MHDLRTVTTDSLEPFELLTNFQTIDEIGSLGWDETLTGGPAKYCCLQSGDMALECWKP